MPAAAPAATDAPRSGCAPASPGRTARPPSAGPAKVPGGGARILTSAPGLPAFVPRKSALGISPARHFAFYADERFLPIYPFAA